MIRFRCFVRFAGSRPSPSSSPSCPRFPSSIARVLHPPALVPHGCLSISIPYTVRSLFIYRFNEHVRDKASRNIDIGWSIPVRLAVPCWRVLHLSLGKKNNRPITISRDVSEMNFRSTRHRYWNISNEMSKKSSSDFEIGRMNESKTVRFDIFHRERRASRV